MLIGLIFAFVYLAGLTFGLYVAGESGEANTVGYVSAYFGIFLVLFCAMVPTMFQHMLDPALDPRQYTAIVPPSPKLSLALVTAMGIGPFGIVWLCLATLPFIAMWLGAGQPLIALCAGVAGFIQYYIGVLFTRLGIAVLGLSHDKAADKGSWKALIVVVTYLVFVVGIAVVIPLLQSFFTLDQILFVGKILSTTGTSGAFVWPTLIAEGAWITLLINMIVTAAIALAAFYWWHRLATQAMLQGKARTLSPADKQAINAAALGQHVSQSPPSVMLHNPPPALPFVDRATALGLSEQSAAIIARIFIYTKKDIRITSQTLIGPLFLLCAIAFIYIPAQSFTMWEFIVFAGLFGNYAILSSISLDAKAVWLHVASPVNIRHDVFGRLVAHSVIPLVIFFVAGPLIGALIDHPHAWFVVPTLLLSTLLCSTAVWMFGMARWTSPQAKAGKLTMKGAGAGMSGAVIARMLVAFLVVAVTMIPPAIALVFAYHYLSLVWAMVTCVGVVIYAVVLVIASYHITCNKLVTNYPNLLSTIRTYP